MLDQEERSKGFDGIPIQDEQISKLPKKVKWVAQLSDRSSLR
jgi:hypothetical protein